MKNIAGNLNTVIKNPILKDVKHHTENVFGIESLFPNAKDTLAT